MNTLPNVRYTIRMSADVTRTSPPDATRTGAGTAPLPPASPLDAPPGFILDREIGAGGMGVVYLARQSGLNRIVALKTVRSGTTLDARALIRFLAEAESIASVRHPNVVEVYSFGEHAGRPYLALEYCAGGDLTTVSKAEQTRDASWFRRTADLMAKIADGVNAAHAQGIVHRDLKPANVLLTADGTPKVTDFGLAKRGLGSDLTHTQDVLGTPAYMAPEQASGRTKFVGPEADVWALGVMLYELLCGQRPIDAPNPLELMAAVAKADVPKLRDRFPTVPTDLALIAHKCLSGDPRDRYPTAGALATDLRNWLGGKPVSVRPAGVIESAAKWVKRNKRVALTGAGVLLVMATATAVSFGFGLDANAQRTHAKADAKRAEDEKQSAIDARNEAVAANAKSERALAKAFIAKLIYTRNGGDEAEMSTIHWEVLDSRQTSFGKVLIEELTTYPVRSGNELHLSSAVLHSLVGLDAKARGLVERVFGERIRDPNTPESIRNCLLLAIAQEGYWHGPPDELTDRVVDLYKNYVPLQDESAERLATCAARSPARTEEMADLMIARLCSGRRLSLWGSQAYHFAQLIRQLPSSRTEDLAVRAVREFLKRFQITTDVYEKGTITIGIGTLSGLLPSSRRESLLGEFASLWLQQIHAARDAPEREILSGGVTMWCDRLDPALSKKVVGEVVPLLRRDFVRGSESHATEDAAIELAGLTQLLTPNDREEIAEQLTQWLSLQLAREVDSWSRQPLLLRFVLMTGALSTARSEVKLAEALKLALDDSERAMIEQGRARFGMPPDTPDVATRAAEFLAEMEMTWYWQDQRCRDVPHALEALCFGLSREELHRRKAFPAVAGGLVSPDSLPKPKPLPPQVLVDLLKRPFVVREKRRAVLNALEFTYDRKFEDVWEFVAFAEKQHPELDLLTPPKRPEKK